MATAQSNSLLNAWIKLYRARKRSAVLSLCGAGLALAVIATLSLASGSTAIPVQDTVNMITRVITGQPLAGSYDASLYTILFTIRLPRILMAGLVGSALAVAGAAYQGMFRNPLADPYLTGISQGAALGAVIGFLLPAALPVALIPILGFMGAVISVTVVFFIARTGKTVPVTTLILGGVAVGAFLASFTSYLLIVSGDKLHGIIFWLLGTFSLSDWSRVAIMTPYILAGMAVLMLMARPLNVMQLDEEQARQLGINVERTKLLILAAATLATAAAVCFCGAIGFVGIIIPHAVRMILGPDYRLLLPFSALAGACFLILADTAARTLLAPTEIPVGVITALIGAPFFLYLLQQKEGDILMSGITLANASFRYGKQLILHDVNLETSAGEFLGVIGPNGCGKSTLLKGMSGLLRPYRGHVFLNGLDIAENNHGYTARNIALVPQNVALPPLFTVMDIVLMGRTPHLKLLQYEGKLDIGIAIDAMEATRTLQLADKRINQLSGGEKQRVLIARALAQQAGILLLDEPTANLDINYQAEILNFVRQLCRSKELSVVTALHDLNLASQYCDRIIMLKDGYIWRQGNPSEVLDAAAIRDIYGVDVLVYPHPVNSLPTALVTPRDTAGEA